MFRFLAAPVVALLLAAAPAAAQDYSRIHLETFEAVCLANGASPEKALAAARERGWLSAPQEFVEGYRAKGGVETSMLFNLPGDDLFQLFNDPALAILVIGEAPEEMFGGMKGDYCGLLPRSGDPEAVRRDLAKWVGAEPVSEGDYGPFWVYTVVAGARTPVADDDDDMTDEEFFARMRATPHYFVGMMDGIGGPAMFMMRPIP